VAQGASRCSRSLLRPPSSMSLDVAEGVCEGEPEPPCEICDSVRNQGSEHAAGQWGARGEGVQ